MSLTLLVPDLLPPAGESRAPALEKWLARARVRREPGTGTAWLLRQWGLGPDAPVAALTLAADGGPREGAWLRADPVHQRVERHALCLLDASVLALSREEADEAVAALNAFFAADGLVFAAPAVDRWYVRVADGDWPGTVALGEAVGRNPFGMLPSGGAGRRWASRFSEAQMLLAALPLNEKREAEGRPALNGVWFWGGGEMPADLPRPFAEVATDDPLARSLALASGAPLRPAPAGLAGEARHPGGESLVVLGSLQAALRRGDPGAWTAALACLERDWFANLGRALGTLRRVRVVLPSRDDTAIFDLDAGARWRLLRRPAPLDAHA